MDCDSGPTRIRMGKWVNNPVHYKCAKIISNWNSVHIRPKAADNGPLGDAAGCWAVRWAVCQAGLHCSRFGCDSWFSFLYLGECGRVGANVGRIFKKSRKCTRMANAVHAVHVRSGGRERRWEYWCWGVYKRVFLLRSGAARMQGGLREDVRCKWIKLRERENNRVL